MEGGKDRGFEMHDVRKPDLSVGPMTREFVHGPFLRPRHCYGVYSYSASAAVFFFLLTIFVRDLNVLFHATELSVYL